MTAMTFRRADAIHSSFTTAPIPRCPACGAPVCELVNPAADGGPRFVAVEPGPGVVGEPYYRPARMQLHADVCPGQPARVRVAPTVPSAVRA
jgi:hypothetical protein